MQPPEKKVLEAPEHNDIFENATDENFLEDDGGVTVTQVPMQSSTTVACSGSDQLYTAECSDESYDSDEFSSNYSDTTSDMTKDLESEDESACQSDTVPDSVDDKHCNVFKSHAFLTFAMKHNLAGNAIDDLIDLFNSTCSDSSNTWLPKNYNDLLKTIVQPEIIQHHYCRFCLELYPPDKCNEYRCKTRQCNGLRYVGHVDKQMQASRKADSVFSIADIGAQFQLILSKPGIWESILNTKHRIKTGIDNPNLQDITDGQAYKKIAVVGGFLDPDSPNISLSFNTDGIPLFSSSGVKLWPVFFVINELPPALRFSRENVILAGLWQGKSNVPFYHYLTEIGKQLYKLYTRGIEFNLAKIEIVKPKICVLIGCVDLQAKAYIANMTMHNGEYGCITCMEPGKTVPQGKGTSRCYPYHSPEEMQPYRESEEMKLSAISASRKKRINGICGSSGLQNWPLFDLVLGLVPDYMHGVLLGVTKTLLHKWLSSANSKKRYFVGDKVKEISKRLKSISPPDYIERLPRDLEKHYAHFKANELQAWLLHYSLPCLTGILPDTYLQHFSMLSEGIHILLKNTIDDHDFARAQYLLDGFYKNFSDLYEDGSCGLNIHNVGRHLVFYVKQWGPLFGWSCFCFEDFNAKLLGYTHGTGDVTNQIFKRHLASMFVCKTDNSAIKNEKVATFIRQMNRANKKSPKIKVKTKNCDIIGAQCELHCEGDGAEFDRAFLQHINVNHTENLRKVLRIIVNGQKFYGSLYSKMKKRQCNVALTISGDVVVINFFVYNVFENEVYLVGNKMEENTNLHLYENSGHHIFLMKETLQMSVMPVDVLSQKVFIVKVGQIYYISKPPNLFGYSVLK